MQDHSKKQATPQRGTEMLPNVRKQPREPDSSLV